MTLTIELTPSSFFLDNPDGISDDELRSYFKDKYANLVPSVKITGGGFYSGIATILCPLKH